MIIVRTREEQEKTLKYLLAGIIILLALATISFAGGLLP